MVDWFIVSRTRVLMRTHPILAMQVHRQHFLQNGKKLKVSKTGSNWQKYTLSIQRPNSSPFYLFGTYYKNFNMQKDHFSREKATKIRPSIMYFLHESAAFISITHLRSPATSAAKLLLFLPIVSAASWASLPIFYLNLIEHGAVGP